MDRYSSRDECSAVELDQPGGCLYASGMAQTVGPLTRLLRLRNILVLLMGGVLVVSCSGDSRDANMEYVGAEVPAVDLTASVHSSTRELLEQQVGIERTRRVAELITDHVDSIYPYVKYRTFLVQLADQERRSRELGGVSDDERQDARFEILVQVALFEADGTRSGDIAEGSGRMHDAYSAALEECARDSGLSDVNEMLGVSAEDFQTEAHSEEEYIKAYGEEFADAVRQTDGQLRHRAEVFDQVAESLGFTRDELLDIRHSCSRYAATLPSLDPDVREDLFRQLHEHYLNAVRVVAFEGCCGA